MKQLEIRVSAIEKQVGPPDLSHLFAKPERRGRKRGIRDLELREKRDILVDLFEGSWPELRVAIAKAIRAKASQRLAKAIKHLPKQSMAWEVPLIVNPGEHCGAMLKFVLSRRYRGNPRNLANAMAGVPKVSGKRSFDLCSAMPCGIAIGQRAYRDWLLRNHKQRFDELLKVRTPEQAAEVLTRSRTKNPHYDLLRRNPPFAMECLKAGLVIKP